MQRQKNELLPWVAIRGKLVASFSKRMIEYGDSISLAIRHETRNELAMSDLLSIAFPRLASFRLSQFRFVFRWINES